MRRKEEGDVRWKTRTMNRILKFSVTASVRPMRKLCKMTPNSRMAMPTSWAEARAGVVVVWCEACSRSRVGVEIDFSCSRSVTVSWSLEVPSAVWGSEGSRQRGGCAWVDVWGSCTMPSVDSLAVPQRMAISSTMKMRNMERRASASA